MISLQLSFNISAKVIRLTLRITQYNTAFLYKQCNTFPIQRFFAQQSGGLEQIQLTF
jgi:hypothetical protein